MVPQKHIANTTDDMHTPNFNEGTKKAVEESKEILKSIKVVKSYPNIKEIFEDLGKKTINWYYQDSPNIPIIDLYNKILSFCTQTLRNYVD